VAREVVYTDDLDGTHGAEPVQFGWDGITWEIDLAEPNHKKLAEALQPFLDKAHPAQVAQPKSTTTRTRTAAAAGDRIDYSSPEHAGSKHRGRVTEAEAAYVRDNFDAVNKRLSAEGQDMLDPSDEKTIKRYGLDQPNSKGQVIASR
jgi:Lsr2